MPGLERNSKNSPVDLPQHQIDSFAAFPKISIILVNYNGMPYLNDCISSMSRQSLPAHEIILVDNASTDGSAAYVRQNYPHVRVIESKENLGYAQGSNVGCCSATGDYLVICNVDVQVENDWLEYLISPLLEDERVKIVTPKILLFDQPELVNTCGNFIQFTGHAGSIGFGKPGSQYTKRTEVACPSGACFITERKLWIELDGFDVALLLTERNQRLGMTSQNYYQEADFTWKLLAKGYRVVCEPRSILYHKYRVKPVTAQRFFDLEITHWTFLLKHFGKRIILFSLPAFFFSELISWMYAGSKGVSFVQQKLNAYRWLWQARREILQKRRYLQQERVIPEKELFKYLTAETQFAHQFQGSSYARYLEKTVNQIYRCLYSIAGFALNRVQ